MAQILAIDTSTGPCSVAIWSEGRITAYIENAKPVMQSASLIPMVEEALAKSVLRYSDLTLVACTVGPGSFTGIRVGLASARGIAFAAGIPSAGYTTLEVMAYAARKKEETILSVLNAGKGEYYCQSFATVPHLHSLNEPQLCLPGEAEHAAQAASVTVVGNVALAGITCAITFPRADALAEMAANSTLVAQPLRPYYIRPPDAKLPKQRLIDKII